MENIKVWSIAVAIILVAGSAFGIWAWGREDRIASEKNVQCSAVLGSYAERTADSIESANETAYQPERADMASFVTGYSKDMDSCVVGYWTEVGEDFLRYPGSIMQKRFYVYETKRNTRVGYYKYESVEAVDPATENARLMKIWNSRLWELTEGKIGWPS